MARVRFDALTAELGRGVRARRVLDRIDLDIADGTILAVLGPSGAGKSTLLRVVAGLEAPTSGRIVFDDRDVTALGPEQRDVGFVFQRFALYPHLDVAENIGFGLRVRHLPAATRDARVRALARVLQIEGLLARRPASLSGGEAQRVAIARALAIEPALLALDEPFSNLDARLRDDLRLELFRVQRAFATTTLFVTHDQSDALSFADAIAVVRAGRIEQVGAPREIYDRPATEFVARFVGSPPMGFLRGPLPALDGAFVASANPRYGIRPEHVRSGGAGDVELEGIVRAVEDRGAVAYARLETPSGEVTCGFRHDERAPREGERLAVAFDRAHVHAFDGESGRRLEAIARV
jgi:ABC-type sugar transport system ATPase subunit